MSDTVEWAVHCCTVLGTLPRDQALPAARLAEFHDVPPAYLAKALQAMTVAGITESRPGPLGGYRLARPPAEVTLLEVVLAVDGDDTAFQCREIRRRGPVVVLIDLDSTNGTIVNGRRVREHPLADGDRITLGNSRLTFERRTT